MKEIIGTLQGRSEYLYLIRNAKTEIEARTDQDLSFFTPRGIEDGITEDSSQITILVFLYFLITFYFRQVSSFGKFPYFRVSHVILPKLKVKYVIITFILFNPSFIQNVRLQYFKFAKLHFIPLSLQNFHLNPLIHNFTL